MTSNQGPHIAKSGPDEVDYIDTAEDIATASNSSGQILPYTDIIQLCNEPISNVEPAQMSPQPTPTSTEATIQLPSPPNLSPTTLTLEGFTQILNSSRLQARQQKNHLEKTWKIDFQQLKEILREFFA